MVTQLEASCWRELHWCEARKSMGSLATQRSPWLELQHPFASNGLIDLGPTFLELQIHPTPNKAMHSASHSHPLVTPPLVTKQLLSSQTCLGTYLGRRGRGWIQNELVLRVWAVSQANCSFGVNSEGNSCIWHPCLCIIECTCD